MTSKAVPSLLDRILPDSTVVDPNQFMLQWDVLFEVLAAVIVLALLIERLLALVFESKRYLRWKQRISAEDPERSFVHKELSAYALSAFACVIWQLDILGIIFSHAYPSVLGSLVTAGLVAGGSKASIKLFHDVLGAKSSAYDKYRRGETV